MCNLFFNRHLYTALSFKNPLMITLKYRTFAEPKKVASYY
jgi:hypothetical protein